MFQILQVQGTVPYSFYGLVKRSLKARLLPGLTLASLYRTPSPAKERQIRTYVSNLTNTNSTHVSNLTSLVGVLGGWRNYLRCELVLCFQ